MPKKISENMDNRMPEGMSEDVLDRTQKNEKWPTECKRECQTIHGGKNVRKHAGQNARKIWYARKYGGNNFKTYVKTPRNHGRQVWHEHIFVTVVISEVSYLFAVFLHVFSSSSPICRGCIRKRLVFRSILWHESNKIWRCFFLSGFSVHVFGSELAGIGQRLSLQFLVASRW